MKKNNLINRLACSLFLVGSMATGSALAQFSNPTSLKLINGWKNAPFSTSDAQIQTIDGIVKFKGAIATSGTNMEPFVLPAAFRPSTYVYISVDLCHADNGRLEISPSGVVTVQEEGSSIVDAKCSTNLDGASFALNSSGFTPVTLLDGWKNAPFGTSNAEVKNINGIVHFKGAIANPGTWSELFVLPAGFRPAHFVNMPVDLCDAGYGELDVSPQGVVTVEAATYLDDPGCFTSLDGVVFVADNSGFEGLSLRNGWTDTTYETASPKAKKINGIVYLQGAMSTYGSNDEPFVLPSSLIPATYVYVPVDLCDIKGRLQIQPNGVVTVQAESGESVDAQCFTSLDGASYVP
jgi:hypothetical protein